MLDTLHLHWKIHNLIQFKEKMILVYIKMKKKNIKTFIARFFELKNIP